MKVFLLLVLICGVIFSADTVQQKASSTEEIQKPKKVKSSSKNVNLYVRQQEIIALEPQIEQALSNSSVCQFSPRKPLFSKLADHLVSQKRDNPQTALFNRLRTVEDQSTEALIVLEKYVFVLSDNNQVTTFSREKQLEVLSKYKINGRTPQNFPFAFGDQVLFVLDDKVIVCNSSGSTTIKKEARQVRGIPTQVSDTLFVVMSTSELDIYSYSNNKVVFKHVITAATMEGLFKTIKVVQWVKCKKIDDKLYCLDANNGLFTFQQKSLLKNNQGITRVSHRVGCFEFYVNPKDSRIYLECAYNQEIFLHVEPKESNAVPIPYVIHRMQSVPRHPDVMLQVRKSSITFMNTVYSDQQLTINYNQPIVDLILMDEVDPDMAESNKKSNKKKDQKADKDKEDKKKTDSQTKKQSDKDSKKAEVTLQPLRMTGMYILFRDRLVKQKLLWTLPHISCRSDTPINQKFQIRLFGANNHQRVIKMNVKVSTDEIKPANKPAFIGTLLLVVIALIIFIAIIHHYQKIERALDSTYKAFLKKFGEKDERRKFDVEMAAV